MSNYLNASTEGPLLRVVEHELLATQQQNLLEKEGSGLRVLLRDKKQADLARMSVVLRLCCCAVNRLLQYIGMTPSASLQLPVVSADPERPRPGCPHFAGPHSGSRCVFLSLCLCLSFLR